MKSNENEKINNKHDANDDNNNDGDDDKIDVKCFKLAANGNLTYCHLALR